MVMVDILKWFGKKEASLEAERVAIENLVKEIESQQKRGGLNLRTKMNIHNHSNESDGLHDWRYIHDLAKTNQIGIVSITDHNGLDNSLRLYESATLVNPQEGITALPGIEVSCAEWNEVLLYFRKPEDLEKFYKEFVESNKKRSLSSFLPKKAYETVEYVVKNFDRKDVAIIIPHPFAQKNWQARKCLTQLIEKGDPESRKYQWMLDTATGIELINGFHAPKCNLRTVNWVRANPTLIGNHHFVGNPDYHSEDSSWRQAYTLIHSSQSVTYNDIFDALTSKPEKLKMEPKMFFQPVGTRINVPAYFKQVILAGMIRAFNFGTGKGFEEYQPRFMNAENII